MLQLKSQRFEILGPLGSGAMGLVYEAVDRDTNTRVAVKTLLSLEGDGLARFKAEFREFQHLSHPNLVSLGELFEDDGTWFFTMELVRGTSLIEWVRGDGSTRDDRQTLAAPPPPVAPAGPDAEQPQVPWGRFDEVKTRSAMLQLAQGLVALHDAGKVHRDLKPENVLVTAEGRVVLVDFGLGIDTETQASHEEREIVGTVAYMAPEQAAARRLTFASDWYAFGTILFECLTGCIPFDGPPIKVLTAKQTHTAPAVRALSPEVPADLAGLADALLRHDPHARPRGPDVVAALSGSSPSSVSSTASLGQVFVGREDETRRLLESARRASRGEGPCFVLLESESGLGKSSLLRHFDRLLIGECPELWRLSGVCYERESSPYKGVDGAIDELARFLGELPLHELEAVLPEDAPLLAEFFPVLSRVIPLSVAPRELSRNRDPVLLRGQLFAAVRALFHKVAETRPLLLQLDDLQWANADTWALLRDLLASPVPRAMVCVFSVRSEDPQAAVWRERIEEVAGRELERVTLTRLSEPEAVTLAKTLLDRLGGSTSADPSTIAHEAGGDPLFIDALVRTHGLGLEKPTLDEALWRRSEQLPEEARRVLAFVALSKSSLEQEAVARAAGLTRPELNRQVAALRVLHLVRSTGVRMQDTVSPYHDRVRVAVRSHLAPDAAKQLQRQLALAVEASGRPDLEALAWHWSEAGEPTRAAVYAERAGEQAAQRLAFARAAQLFSEALGTGVFSPADARRLQARRGEALSNAGHGAEAAAAFLEAARGAEAIEALGYQQRAADQLLRAGYIDRGLESLQTVLEQVGERLTRGPADALASLLFNRARLALRGTGFKERTTAQLAPDVLMRIDATWSASNSLTTVDVIRGAELQTRNLLLTLEAGEPRRVARALSAEASIRAGSLGARASALALNERAEAMIRAFDDPRAVAFNRLTRGIIDFLATRFGTAIDHLASSLSWFESAPAGAWWELGTARLFHLGALWYLGRLAELARLVPAYLDESSRRDDLYAMVNLRLSTFNAVWLMLDEPERALREVDWAIARWSPRGYLAQHYYALVARVNADLYRGHGASAFERIERDWAALKRSQLLRMFSLDFESTVLRARAAIQAATPESLALARRLSSKLARMGTGAARASGLALDSALAKKAGRAAEAQALLAQAALAFDAEGLASSAQAARLMAGGSDAEAARAGLLAQGVRQPHRFARVLIAGYG